MRLNILMLIIQAIINIIITIISELENSEKSSVKILLIRLVNPSSKNPPVLNIRKNIPPIIAIHKIKINSILIFNLYSEKESQGLKRALFLSASLVWYRSF